MATFLKNRGFAAGYTVIFLGVLLLLAGLALDLSLHANDPDLADKEGLLGLGNPGHVIFAAGLAIIVLGVFLGPYSRWVLNRGSLPLSLLVPVAALALALSISITFAVKIDSISGHSHDSSGAAAAHGAASDAEPAPHLGHAAVVLPQHEALVQLEESTFHEPANAAPVTEDNLHFADDFLVKAKAQTAKYQEVAAAQADGYIQITPDLPLIGAHFFNAANVGSLDPARPGILLYERDSAGGWKLVGLAYMLPKQPGVDIPPDTPFGGLAHWHYHTDLCFRPGAQVSIAKSAGECGGGLYVPETPWLLHVWVWKDSPEGVFNHANSLLQ